MKVCVDKSSKTGYFSDVTRRFIKSKTTVVGLIILFVLALYALIVPMISRYPLDYNNGIYNKLKPKVQWLQWTHVFDGGDDKKLNDNYLSYYMAMAIGAEDIDAEGLSYEEVSESVYNPIMRLGDEYNSGGKTYREGRIDSYLDVGFVYMNITKEEYRDIIYYEKKTNINVIYPLIDTGNKYCIDPDDANCWYKTNNNTPLDENDEIITVNGIRKVGVTDNYLRDEDGNLVYYKENAGSMMRIRVLYYNYYRYKFGFEPVHYLGTDGQGYDIFVRMAYGLRLSLTLSVAVAVINVIIGSIWGAMEGYFGGVTDLIGERITDILSGIPFVVLTTIISLHLVNTGIISQFTALLLCYFMTGWIGTAYRVRTQFYIHKNREYIMAARIMGAGHGRVMFRHIFPNAIGTVITFSVLVIPEAIFTESLLSYLGIINFQGDEITSLGTLLSNGRCYLHTEPHIILFPAMTVSLIMVAFNLIGNGLRHAFNPRFRGESK